MTENTEKKEDTSLGKNLADLGGRIVSGLIDGTAATVPIIGMPLQAAFQTDDYQDRQVKRQMAKESLIAAQQKNQEWSKNADLRDAERKKAIMEAEEFAQGAPTRAAQNKMKQMMAEEYAANAPYRKTMLDSEAARARLIQADADEKYKQIELEKWKKGFSNQMAGDPAFNMLSFSDRQNLFLQDDVNSFLEFAYQQNEMLKMAGRDPEASNRLFRYAERNGLTVENGKNGIKELVGVPEIGRFPLTREGLEKTKQVLWSRARKEIDARALISAASTLGDPAKRAIAKYAKALMPYNNDSAAKSVEFIKGVYDSSSDEEKGWHLLNQAFQDYQDSGVPQTAKMAELQACARFLPKMGFSVEGIDPKNPDIRNATFLDLASGNRLTYDQFGKLCGERDSLGQKLKERISMAQWSAIMQQNQKAIIYNNALSQQKNNEIKLLKAQNSAKKNSSAPNESEEELSDRELDERQFIKEGESFIKQNNLQNEAENVWRAAGTKNKFIQSRKDVLKLFAGAREYAENEFAKSGDYAVAQNAWNKVFEDHNIPAEAIPDIWGDQDLRDRKARLIGLLKEDIRKDSENRNKNPDYSSRPYGGGALSGGVPQKSQEEKSRKARERKAQELNKIDKEILERKNARSREKSEPEKRRDRFRRGE